MTNGTKYVKLRCNTCGHETRITKAVFKMGEERRDCPTFDEDGNRCEGKMEKVDETGPIETKGVHHG